MKQLELKNKSFAYLQEDFRNWLDILGYSKQILYQLPVHVREFLHWLEQKGINHITEIDTTHFYSYYEYLRARANQRDGGGLSNPYLNKHLEGLQRFMDYLRQMGGLELPCFEQRIEETDQKPRTILTVAEIEELYRSAERMGKEENGGMSAAQQHALSMRDKAMLSVFYACGLRRNEGNHLTVNDIDFDRKLLHVTKGKGYKERFVPFTKKTSRILSDYVFDGRRELLNGSKHQAFFISCRQGKPASENILWRRLKRLQETSRLDILRNKAIGLHTLRHSIATHLLQRGMKLEQISRFLGHGSLVSTQVYTHLAEEYEEL